MPPDNIISIPDIIGIKPLPYETERKLALEFEAGKGSVTHVTHTYRFDNHPAHRRNGEVIKRLSDEGRIKHAMYFVKPTFARYRKDLYAYNVVRHGDRNAVEAAIEAYDRGHYNVGFISSPRSFIELIMDPFYTVYLQKD